MIVHVVNTKEINNFSDLSLYIKDGLLDILINMVAQETFHNGQPGIETAAEEFYDLYLHPEHEDGNITLNISKEEAIKYIEELCYGQ